MTEPLIWVLSIGAVLAVLFMGLFPARRRIEEDGPPSVVDDEGEKVTIATNAQVGIDGLWDDLEGTDPAGSIADASNDAHNDR